MDIIDALLNDPSVSDHLKRMLERKPDLFGWVKEQTPEYLAEQTRKNLHMRAMMACAQTKQR